MRRYGVYLLSMAIFIAGSSAHAKTPDSPLQLPNDVNYWRKASFQKMTAPLRLPTNSAGTDTIQVWLKIPDGAKMTVKRIYDSSQMRWTLVYPPGTIADRVEFTAGAFGVDDVRGARIDKDGKSVFHVYETSPFISIKNLVGYEWPRQGDRTDVEMGEKLIKLFYRRGDIDGQRDFRNHNHCASCHQENAPAPMTIQSRTPFESDSRGFFQPISVLSAAITVRDHREWDQNADDPFITVRCGRTPTRAITERNKRYYRCADGAAPVGELNVEEALKAGDPHAKELCASRRYLFSHMDRRARRAFAAAFSACGISPAD